MSGVHQTHGNIGYCREKGKMNTVFTMIWIILYQYLMDCIVWSIIMENVSWGPPHHLHESAQVQSWTFTNPWRCLKHLCTICFLVCALLQGSTSSKILASSVLVFCSVTTTLLKTQEMNFAHILLNLFMNPVTLATTIPIPWWWQMVYLHIGKLLCYTNKLCPVSSFGTSIELMV